MARTDPHENLPPLVRGLLDPRAYPHPVAVPIRLSETHVSWVLLTGEFAYKLKKPLRLDFLDYSTPDLRRRCCEEEVRLNRRHAPGLYLGVAAIGGSPDAPRVEAAGPAIEHAVKMRQFDASDELVALVAAGAASDADLRCLGGAIGELHARAAVAAPDTEYGSPAVVQRVMRDNFAALGRLPADVRDASGLEPLAVAVAAEFERRRDLVASRRAGGRVRECHGDLHCGNVVRWRGRLVPFDGIEFDDALRWIDVANDIAFLTMDLAERGHAGLARAALQGWLEDLGDFEALALLPFYEAARALVRAKVAALRVLLGSPGDAPAQSYVQAADYLAWAARRLEPRRALLVLTCGLSGSGKTWLADRIARRRGLLHVRSDVERKRLAGLGPLDDSGSPPDGGIYTLEFNERTYARLLDCARSAIEGGASLVVDAAFLRARERTAFLELARRLGAPAAVLHCRAPIEVLRERVRARRAAGHDASEADVALLERQQGYWEPLTGAERAVALDVDTSDDGAVELALASLSRATG
jgi:aminoglycoside phosphotransferase family enzyme/predicted kinase